MRKAQFFIATIVLVSLTIVLTVMTLRIPQEIDANTLVQNELMNANILFMKQTLNELMSYFRLNWIVPYTHRTIITVNANFTTREATDYSNINLPDGTYITSLKFVNENGFNVPFSVQWTNITRKEGRVYFQADSEAISKNNYYLYYNTAPGKTIISNKERTYDYGEDTDNFWIKTSSYYALISKTQGGSIKVLNISGSQDIVNDIDSVINCRGTVYTLTGSLNKAVTLTPEDYFLKAEFTGSRFANETYKITELFFPDEILINDEMTLAADSNCNYWSVNVSTFKSTLENYVDNSNLLFEPIPPSGSLYAGYTSWREGYNNNGYSLGFYSPLSVQTYITAAPTISYSEYHYINTTSIISKGVYNSELRITPLAGARFNATRKYAKPSTTAINEVFNTEFNNLFNTLKRYFYDYNAIVSITKDTGLIHESFSNSSEWHYSNYNMRDFVTARGLSVTFPAELRLRLSKGADTNSIILNDIIELPYQVSTDNYEMGNSGISLANNNSLLLFSPNGKNFNITITKTSGDLTGKMYYPNGSPLNEYNIDNGGYIIQVINNNQSGFYEIILNGTADFMFSTTLPKSIARLPLEVANTSPIYLLVNESVTTFDLNINTYTSNLQNFTIYGPSNEFIGSVARNSPGTSTITKAVTPCLYDCIYRLEFNNIGNFMINSTGIKYASGSNEFMINPDSPEVIIINVKSGIDKNYFIYYNNNTFTDRKSFTSDLNYSLVNKQVNNSYYSFDLNNIKFYYKGTEWFGTRGWTSCRNGECTNSFTQVRFVELGSERVTAWINTSVGLEYYFSFYPSIPYFNVVTKNNGEFGPGWMVNNTLDKYYQYNGGIQELIGTGTKYISKTNITGMQGYITKSNDYVSASIIFEPNKLDINKSIQVNSTSLIIKASQAGTYGFVINQDPLDYITPVITRQESIRIKYNYTTNELITNGQLIG